MRRLGIGIIGAGKHGARYARHAGEVDGAALTALCRRDRAAGGALAQAHGCAFHDDWPALVADTRVDAIVTAVPPSLNAAIVEAACRAGKPILIEKPLAPTLAEAERIAAVVARAGVTAMVAQTLRFDATVAVVRAHAPLVAPVHAMTLAQRFEPSVVPWLDRAAISGGGILLHTGIHSIDLLRFLSGREVAEVSCRTARVLTRETEDNFVLHARLEDGVLATIAGSRAMVGRTGLLELAGGGGQIVADHSHRVAWLVRGGERTALPVGDAVPTVRETLQAFVRAVRDGAPVPVTIEDGVRAVAIVDAAYRSAARGGAAVTVTART